MHYGEKYWLWMEALFTRKLHVYVCYTKTKLQHLMFYYLKDTFTFHSSRQTWQYHIFQWVDTFFLLLISLQPLYTSLWSLVCLRTQPLYTQPGSPWREVQTLQIMNDTRDTWTGLWACRSVGTHTRTHKQVLRLLEGLNLLQRLLVCQKADSGSWPLPVHVYVM